MMSILFIKKPIEFVGIVMRLKLSYGQQELFSQFPVAGRVNVRQVIMGVKTSHPQIYQRLCNSDGHLRESLTVFVNGEHIRYRNGWETVLEEGDEIYIVPLITGG
jgi:molybdopterin synthase sulfur carrier subunit